MQTILLIANPATLTDVSKTLTQYFPECSLITAATESEGIEIAKNQSPDTIIIDMDDMAGYEICRKLKSDTATQFISIISTIDTFDSNSQNSGMLLNHQADILFPRSLNPVLLVAQINTMLRIKESEKQLKKSLRKSEERLQLALEGTDDSIFDWNMKCGDLYYDQKWPKILGYTPGEIIFDFDWWKSSVHPDSVPVFKKALQDHLEGKKKYCELDYRMQTKSGEWKWIAVRGKVSARDSEGEPVRFTGMHRDITERKIIQNELLEIRDHYSILADSIADAVIVIQDRKLVFANNAFVMMFEFSNKSEVIGLDPLVFLTPSFKKSFIERYESSWQEERGDNRFQSLCITRNSREFWIEGHAAFFQWEGEKADLVVIRDINELKIREITLENESKNFKKVKNDLMAGVREYFRFGDLVGKSQQMQTVYGHIINAAATDANVIILGESGTGKELVARAIHNSSNRKDNKIIPVNCGAIPESLLESEFFGYKKGAFSGAHTDKNGYLDIADKGTLFLDEVGEIGLNIQVKLLRVIDGEGFIPVGGNKTSKPDVRIICATNRNLEELVQQGLLREDFYYRINVIPINLPPLRDRKEDISYLVEHFMVMHDPEHKSPPIPAKTMDMLRNYHWPGNVRELNSVIQRYITFKKIVFLGLPEEIELEEDTDEMEPDCDLLTAQHNFEKKFILQTLTRHNWHRGKTASALNISRKTLFRKMKSLNLGQI